MLAAVGWTAVDVRLRVGVVRMGCVLKARTLGRRLMVGRVEEVAEQEEAVAICGYTCCCIAMSVAVAVAVEGTKLALLTKVCDASATVSPSREILFPDTAQTVVF